jgi:hypothetical protein
MEPEYNSGEGSEDEDANAMAAFMGFSAFGSQKPPTKKRKFNPTTDAFVGGTGTSRSWIVEARKGQGVAGIPYR